MWTQQSELCKGNPPNALHFTILRINIRAIWNYVVELNSTERQDSHHICMRGGIYVKWNFLPCTHFLRALMIHCRLVLMRHHIAVWPVCFALLSKWRCDTPSAMNSCRSVANLILTRYGCWCFFLRICDVVNGNAIKNRCVINIDSVAIDHT